MIETNWQAGKLTDIEIQAIKDLIESEHRNNEPGPLTFEQVKQIRLDYLRPVLATYLHATSNGRSFAMLEALAAIRKELA